MSSTLAHPNLPPPILNATFGAPKPAPMPSAPSNNSGNTQVDDEDKDEREGGSFLKHLACDVCHVYFEDEPNVRYWMTSCGHVLCEAPGHKSKPKTCTACNKTMESFPIVAGMSPHFDRWFQDTRNPVKAQFGVLNRAREMIGELAATESLMRVLQFQVVHLKGHNTHLRESDKKHHDAYAVLKEENAALREENGALKNENSTLKTSYKTLELKKSTLESRCSALEIENSTLSLNIDDLQGYLANSMDAPGTVEKSQYLDEGPESNPFISRVLSSPVRADPYANSPQYPPQYGGPSRADAYVAGSGKRQRMTVDDQRQQRFAPPQTPSHPQSQFMTPRLVAGPYTPNHESFPIVSLGLNHNRPSSFSPGTGRLDKFRYQGNAQGPSTPERPLEPRTPRSTRIAQPHLNLDAPQTSLTGNNGHRPEWLDKHLKSSGTGAARQRPSGEMLPPPVPVQAQAQTQKPYSQPTHAIPQTPQHHNRTNHVPGTPQVSQNHEEVRVPMAPPVRIALPTSVNRTQVREDKF